MIIGIDGNESNIQNRVGVNWYAYEVIKNLHILQGKTTQDHEFIVYLKEKPLSDMPKENDKWKYMVMPGRGLWILTKLMPYLLFTRYKPQVLFSPSHYTVPFTFIPRICSIMDLGYLNSSEQFRKCVFWQLKIWSAISIIVSKRIIAISNATKDHIVRQYPLASNKVDVTLLGYDKSKFNIAIPLNDVRRIREKYHIVDDYVVMLSTLKPNKNVEGVLRAFHKYLEKNEGQKNIQLVIAGKRGWMFNEIFSLVTELKMEEKVIFTDFIDESDKPALMKGAKLLISPSFWEGFGLHVLESMACGTPVIVSSVGSLPEVVGNAGIVVDPFNTDSIAHGLEKVLNASEKSY